MSNCKKDLKKIIQRYISDKEFSLLEEIEKEQETKRFSGFDQRFGKIRRVLNRTSQNLIIEEKEACNNTLIIENWDLLRLTRVWLLSLLPSNNKEAYIQTLDDLFAFADVKESVALYSALSLIPYSEYGVRKCEEGIRGNIGAVHQAIMENNFFPMQHLNQIVWNQLVLKAFFTDKNVLHIQGLFEKRNSDLAGAVKDYILERNAAKRSIHPVLWVLAEDKVNTERMATVFENELVNVKDDFQKHCLSYTYNHNTFLQEKIKQKYPEVTDIQATLDSIKNFKDK